MSDQTLPPFLLETEPMAHEHLPLQVALLTMELASIRQRLGDVEAASREERAARTMTTKDREAGRSAEHARPPEPAPPAESVRTSRTIAPESLEPPPIYETPEPAEPEHVEQPSREGVPDGTTPEPRQRHRPPRHE